MRRILRRVDDRSPGTLNGRDSGIHFHGSLRRKLEPAFKVDSQEIAAGRGTYRSGTRLPLIPDRCWKGREKESNNPN